MYEWNDKIICPWDPTANPKRIAQYKDYYKVKHDICAELKPNIIVEIGVRAGYSAYHLLQAQPKAIYYGFDADNGTHGGQGPRHPPDARLVAIIADPRLDSIVTIGTCVPHQVGL